ncbi:hypothetical protein [Endozoicomonas sp. 2B-B]
MKLIFRLAGSTILALAFGSVHALDRVIYFIRNYDSDHSVSYSFRAGSDSSCMYGVYTPGTDSMPPGYLNISKLGLHYRDVIFTDCGDGDKPRYQDIVISRDTPPKATAVVRWHMPVCDTCGPYAKTKSDPANLLKCPFDHYGYSTDVMLVVGQDVPGSGGSCRHDNFRD